MKYIHLIWNISCLQPSASLWYVVLRRFYVDTIGLLRDIQTVELFYFNARQAIFKVSFHFLLKLFSYPPHIGGIP